MTKRWFPWIFLAPFAIAFFLALGGWVVAWLWNALLPPLFGFPVIGFWQALGILALSRILFGGFGGGSSKHKQHGKGHYRGGPRGHFTAEEREHIRQHLKMQFAGEEADESTGDED